MPLQYLLIPINIMAKKRNVTNCFPIHTIMSKTMALQANNFTASSLLTQTVYNSAAVDYRFSFPQ